MRITGKLTLCLVMALSGPASAQDPAPEIGYGWEDKHSVTAESFMVSAANPLAAQAGYDVLADGGTAALTR